MRSYSLLPIFLLLAATGCGGGPSNALPVPSYDPAAMTDAAFAQLDKNKNGTIEGSEFDACPALKRWKGGNPVSKADLKARFDAYAAARADAVTPMSVVVTRDGTPVQGVTVTLTAEPFMGGGFKPAGGVTDETGFAEFKVEGATRGGVPAGFYRLTASKKDASGKEAVPARFNTQSRDVREIFDDGRGSGMPIELNLAGQ